MHGGKAPQVAFKAAVNVEEQKLRQLDHLPASVDVMGRLLEADDESVRLRAAQIIQERFWGKPMDKLKLSGDASEPLEIIISRPKLEDSSAT